MSEPVIARMREGVVAVMSIFARLLCRLRGHDYPAVAFRAGSLYYCRRCGKEICDGKPADLVPLSDEEIEQMHRDNEAGL